MLLAAERLEILMLANENRPPQGWAVENLENLRLSQEESIPIKTTFIVASVSLRVKSKFAGLLQVPFPDASHCWCMHDFWFPNPPI